MLNISSQGLASTN